MSTGKVVLGTMAGIAIGAIAGILLAPKKGSKTRKQIIDKGDDYVNKIKSKFDDFVESLTEKFESAKKEVENLTEKGKV
jgi:gas vesicle protein